MTDPGWERSGACPRPRQQGAWNVDAVSAQECLPHGKEPGRYLSSEKWRAAGLTRQDRVPARCDCAHGPCLTWGLCRGSPDTRLELWVAWGTRCSLGSGLSIAGEHDGPSAFPEEPHFLPLDPHSFLRFYLFIFRERGREGEKHQSVASRTCCEGLNPKSRRVPSPGIKQATFHLAG